ncbi:mycofactocin system GMC family oxidoreductase MftG [Skermania piniformis]|uniref:Mycofactocin system GMC family oxidoreductase MftG n=1 Tax=Skermania pinensis TaxID=39122 RepID=A0ABX8SFQ2_9ACTN|nr:mycofactocin system GMC family oxidoreductase MftG [Skermania piniformis]QXQ14521.1 mycofactocin system GMC family oxidoreductase MftG [Skermania piniformis]
MTEVIDDLVVGAGSCGSVLAARLSDDAERSVTLLDAGGPATHGSLRNAAVVPVGPDATWVDRYQVTLAPGRSVSAPRGRVVGGSGAVNGCYFVRATPADLDGWNLPEWTYAATLPYFRAGETDLDFDGPDHGRAGPLPIRRPARPTEFSAAFTAACRDAGLTAVDDLNSATAGDGVGPVPVNVGTGHRVSPAEAYLSPRAQQPNLRLLTETRVRRVLFAGTRAIGVEAERGGRGFYLRAQRVTLCAGAIESAVILLRSGVGPPEQVRLLGGRVVSPLTGVGSGCFDHPEIGLPVGGYAEEVALPLEVVAHHRGCEIRPYTRSLARLTGAPGCGPWMVGIALMDNESRGRLEFCRPGVHAPRIDYRYLRSGADRDRLRAGVALARELLRSVGARVAADEPTDAWLTAHLGTSQHLAGTCRIGTDGDPDAVADQRGAVRGVDGLFVADAAALPGPISRGPHATLVMLAERIADGLRGRVTVEGARK